MNKVPPILLLFIISIVPVFGQDIGKTFIQNYPPRIYGGMTQNWSLAQDDKGVIYSLNSAGLMEYDGTNWRTLEIPNSNTGRSIAIDKNKVIYIGGRGRFGYLKIDENGNYKYQSLDSQLPDSIQNRVSNIWKIIALDDRVIFRSSRYLFSYKNGKVKYWAPKKSFARGFVLKGKYYAVEIDSKRNKQVKVLENDSLVAIPEFNQFQNRSTFIGFPYKKDTLILGDRNGGFYKYPFSKNHKKDSLFLFSDLNKLAAKTRFYTNGIAYEGGFAIGSANKGIIIFDKNYKYKKTINEDLNGLVADQIYNLMLDEDMGLWAATSNGLARVDLSSEVTFWDMTVGLNGSINYINRFKNELYILTSVSAFTLKKDKIVRLKNAPADQCLHLLHFKNPDKHKSDKLLMSSRSIYELNNTTLKDVAKTHFDLGNIYWMLQDKTNTKRVWLATSDGISSMIYDNGLWKVEPILEGYDMKFIKLKHDGERGFWAISSQEGVYKFSKKEGQERSFNVISFKEEKGLSSLNVHNIDEIEGDIVVGTSKGMYKYNEVEMRFELFKKLGKSFWDGSKSVNHFQQDIHGDIWVSGEFTNNYPVGMAKKNSEGIYILNNKTFKKVPPMSVGAIYSEKNGITWLGGSEGLFRYEENKVESDSEVPYQALIRKVIIGRDSVLYGGNYNSIDSLNSIFFNEIPEIPKEKGAIGFHFTATFFNNESETLFSYYLEGFDDSWSDWTKHREKQYENLWGKTYTFHVKAKNLYGNESLVSSYKFVVVNPWYLRFWAFILYFFMAVILIILIVKWNAKRLLQENERLEGIVKERTKEVQNQNKELQQQSEELQLQSEEITQQRDYLYEANELIKVKNENITASIRYAKRIQNTILPVEGMMDELFQESFVIYKPKDIVSGDFYWLTKVENKIFVAVVDCTGHGVPGAFMSMVGNSLLNKLIKENRETDPSVILSKLDNEVRLVLKQEQTNINDGMDMSLSVIEFENDIVLVKFTGAKSDLFYHKQSDNSISRIKGDRKVIGGGENIIKLFKTHELKFKQGDSIYLLTDGIIDQNNADRERFGSKRLLQQVNDNLSKSMIQQKEMLEERMKDFQGDQFQRDDITVLGIRF